MGLHAETTQRSIYVSRAARLAYLDTNALHEIGYRDARGGNVEELLRSATQDSRIAIPGSLVTIGEIIDGLAAASPDKRERARRQLLIAGRLSDWSKTIHQTSTLIGRDILAYFQRGSTSSFLNGAEFHHFLQGLRSVMRDATTMTPEELANDLSTVIELDRLQKWSFSDGMNEGRGLAAHECIERGWPFPTFEQFRGCGVVSNMLRAWVSRAGLGLVGGLRADEEEGLLRRRAVRVSIAVSLATYYVKEFPVEGPTREFRSGDSGDMHHVIAASAAGADIFVCQERPSGLPRIMDLIRADLAPMEMITLDGLIARIAATPGAS